MIRIPKPPVKELQGPKKPTGAPIFAAKVAGEIAATRLFEAYPRAPGEIILIQMERYEAAFRHQYADWPAEGLEQAVGVFISRFNQTWEKLTANLPAVAKGGYADL